MGYKSNTISIVQVSDENEFYEIFATTNIISKYLVGSAQTYTLEFSPPQVQIEFYYRQKAQQINNLDFKFKVLEKNKESDFSLIGLQEQYNYLKENLNFADEFNKYFIINNTILTIKIQDFYIFISELKKILTQEYINDTPYIWALIDTLASNSGIIKIQWLVDGKLATEGALVINYGLSTEAAKFNINANSINASIGKGLLEFTSEGLHLHNGGLVITADTSKNIEKTVFRIEGDDTVGYNLFLNGNGNFTGNIYADGGYFKGELQAATGSFSGELQAATGRFTGEISALSGNIGGFTIENEQLTSNFIAEYLPYKVNSSDNPQALKLYEKINNSSEYKLTNDETPETGKEYYIGKPSIELKGIEGKIIANSIELGTNAVIQDYIALGKAFLYNPDLNNDLILEAGNVKLDQLGNLTLGNLQYSNNEDMLKGNNWSINPNKAIFNNVDVTGTIHTSVFEIGKIQAVGGGMIFSPASKFEVNSDNLIQLSSTNMTLNNDDVVLLTNDEGNKTEAIVKVDEETKQVSFKEPANINNDISNLKNYDTVIFLNHSGQELLIGVNSSSSNNWELKPQGFSFIVPEKLEGSEYYTEYNEPILFLGNLNGLGIANVNGYGLYGENVYLKGSLTTEVSSKETTYAGVNTINGIKFNPTVIGAPDTLKEDNSNIVFWAGAKENKTEEIQKAKFQVTAQGTIYAQQGYFADSVIVGATIAGNTDISVPAIYGSGTKPSLILSDVETGISFITFNNDKTKKYQIFNIQTNAFSFNQSTLLETPTWIPFISFDHTVDGVTFIGNKIELTENLKLNNFEIINENEQYALRILKSDSDTIQTEKQILYEPDGLKIEYNITNTDISIKNQNIQLNANDVFIPTILSLGEKVDIEKVNGGFNINIQE